MEGNGDMTNYKNRVGMGMGERSILWLLHLLVFFGASHVVFDRQILAADHAISLEPFATELLGCSLRCVGPFHGDAVVVGGLGCRIEGIAGDGNVDGFLRVKHSIGRVHVQTLRVGRFEGEADAVTAGVDDLWEKGFII